MGGFRQQDFLQFLAKTILLQVETQFYTLIRVGIFESRRMIENPPAQQPINDNEPNQQEIKLPPTEEEERPLSNRKSTRKSKHPIHINITNCKYDVVKECAEKFGCKIVDDGVPWHLFWIDTGVSTERVLDMKPYQRINHFPGMHEICRKDHLARNLGRLSRVFPKDYAFFPKTWIFPTQWHDFKLQFKQKKNQAFIAKPDHGCQGKGIFLFRNPQQVQDLQKQDVIVQSYIHNPYLLNGYKFDLRVYVLVTSADPLRIFIYQDGLARFATEPYVPPNEKNMNSVCMHLTNYAINRHSENFSRDEVNGSKRSIQSVFKQLAKEKNVDTNKLWDRICDVIIKTVITVQPQLSRTLKPWLPSEPSVSLNGLGSQCFEILGFDILLDQKLKPWVLEVNHSPSFTCDSPLDKEIKSGVITGALHLLNLSNSYLKKVHKSEKSKSQSRLWKAEKTVKNKHEEVKSAGSDESLDEPFQELNEKNASQIYSLSPTEAEIQETNDTKETIPPRDSVSSESSTGTCSATPLPDVHNDIQKKTRLKMNIQEQKESALQEYKAKYNEQVLANLTKREDTKCGMYKRIFPPTDSNKLALYLHLINETSNWSSETATTKARKQFMIEKQKELEKKTKKLLEWKQKRSHLLAVKARIDATLSPSLLDYRSRSLSERRSGKALFDPDSETGHDLELYSVGSSGGRLSLPATINQNKSKSIMSSGRQKRDSVSSTKCFLPLKMNILTCSESTLSLSRDPSQGPTFNPSLRKSSIISVRTKLQSLNSTKETLSFLSRHGSIQSLTPIKSSAHFDFTNQMGKIAGRNRDSVLLFPFTRK